MIANKWHRYEALDVVDVRIKAFETRRARQWSPRLIYDVKGLQQAVESEQVDLRASKSVLRDFSGVLCREMETA